MATIVSSTTGARTAHSGWQKRLVPSPMSILSGW